jgi:hypothetical protein
VYVTSHGTDLRVEVLAREGGQHRPLLVAGEHDHQMPPRSGVGLGERALDELRADLLAKRW